MKLQHYEVDQIINWVQQYFKNKASFDELKTALEKFLERRDKLAEKMKTKSLGQLINEANDTHLKIEQDKIYIKTERWSDSGVYPSGAGSSSLPNSSSNRLTGFLIISSNDKQLNKYELEDNVRDEAIDYLSDEYGSNAVEGIKLEVQKLSANKFKIVIKSSEAFK